MSTRKKPLADRLSGGALGQAAQSFAPAPAPVVSEVPSSSSSSSSSARSNQASPPHSGPGPAQARPGEKVLAGVSGTRRLEGALMVPVASIVKNPQQIRQDYEGPALDELVSDVKQRGILQPLVVRLNASRDYEIIAGQRRYMAALAAGLAEVPVVVKEMDDQEARLATLVENIQREELSSSDERNFYQTLQNEFNYSVTDIAALIHKSRKYVNNRLNLELAELQDSEDESDPLSENNNEVFRQHELNNSSQSSSSKRSRKAGRGSVVKGGFSPVPFHKFSFTLEQTLRLFEDDELSLTPQVVEEITETVAEVEETLSRLKLKLVAATKSSPK